MPIGPNGWTREDRKKLTIALSRANWLQRYRVDQWQDIPPSRVPPRIKRLLWAVGLVVLVGAAAIEIHHLQQKDVRELYLGSDEVHITSCTFDDFGDGSVKADLINPIGQAADLTAEVEFDDATHSPSSLGTMYISAGKVGGHRSIAVTDTEPLEDSPDVDSLTPPPGRVTCHVIGTETVPLSAK